MNDVHRIVIHVGAPKTGSTYLQNRMRADPAHLRKAGIYVPVLPAVAQMAGNAKLLATALSRRPSLCFQRVFPHIDVSALEPSAIVSELLRDWSSNDESIVLSAEDFRPDHAVAVRKLLPASAPCVVVLFVRRQDQWIESYFNQLTKTGDLSEDLPSFVTRLCDTQGERFCRPDWNAHYEAWRHSFGNCSVVFYEEVKSNIFAAFLHAAGLPTVSDLIDVDRAQVSLNVHELAYLLSLERPFSHSEFVRRRMASAEVSQRLGPAAIHSILGPAERAQLQRRFENSNCTLLNAIGRAYEPALLRLTQALSHRRLDEIYASDGYVRHKELADAIFAGSAETDL